MIDHLCTLNDETPKIKCQPRLDPALIFGLSSTLFLTHDPQFDHVHDEVETLTIEIVAVSRAVLADALLLLPRDAIWRVKGFVLLADEGRHILNWAFGRYELTAYDGGSEGLTVMGRRGDVRSSSAKFVSTLSQQ